MSLTVKKKSPFRSGLQAELDPEVWKKVSLVLCNPFHK